VEVWLKQLSICFASTKPGSNPIPTKKEKQKKEK
jgi:hypothetical protein